jgi:hypothetical protein
MERGEIIETLIAVKKTQAIPAQAFRPGPRGLDDAR